MRKTGRLATAVVPAWIALLVMSGSLAQSTDIAGDTRMMYPRTSAEVAAGVTPSDLDYRPGDVRRYGASGDGRTDDTIALQNALNSSSSVYIPKPPSKYKTDQLQVPSDIEIFIEPGTVIEANTGYGVHDVVFRIVGKSNVKISGYGATVQMLKNEYSGEFRHGISIRGSNNVEVEGIASNDSGGDGFYIGAATQPFSENVTLRDVSANNNRRQGLSIVSGKQIRIIKPHLTNTKGTSPSAGIDIEPNDNSNFLEDVFIDNPYTEGNRGNGITVYLNNLAGPTDKTVTIRIVNPVDKRSRGSIVIGKLDLDGHTLDGQIIITNPVSIEARLSAFTARNYDAAGPRIEIHSPLAIRSNNSGHFSSEYGSAFVVYREKTDAGAANLGNVHFFDAEIRDDRNLPKVRHYFYIRDLTGPDVHNVTINGRISGAGITRAGAMVDFDGAGKVEDTGDLLVHNTADRSFKLAFSNYVRKVTNAGSTRPVTVTLDTVPAGWPAVIFEVREAQLFRVDPDAASRILPGSNGAGKYIQSNETGAKLTLRRRSSTAWFIEEQVGTWTQEK